MNTLQQIEDIPVYELPVAENCKGGIIVIHEVWGLTDHIKDVAERLHKQGYYVLAPDLLSETDIDAHATTQMQQDLFNPEKRNAVQPKLRELMAPIRTPEFAAATADKVKKCFDYLYNLEVTHNRVGVTGFCFGGTYSFTLAVQEPRLKAAAPFYGHADYSVEELRGISCPIQAFYGETDEALMRSLPSLEEKMHEASVDFTATVYANSGHAFFNDSNQYAFNKKAADDAWSRLLEFLESNVSRS